MRVIDIPLPDIMQKYLNEETYHRDGSTNRYKTHCPFHGDTSPSMVLYDKTENGGGWDYHCFVCGAHGTAISMLVDRRIVDNEEQATERIRRDFGYELPEAVTVESFAEYKGLDKQFCYANGWSTGPKGVEIPYMDQNQNVLMTKVRTKYHGKDKYYFKKTSDTLRVQTTPYGLHWLPAYDDSLIYISEGETDCMTMRQAGFQAIGIAGTNGFKDAYTPYLERFKAIVVVKDNDEHGWRLLSDIAEVFPDKTYMVSLPKGTKDINNFHQFRCGGMIDTFKQMFDTLPLLPATPDTFITAVKEGKVLPTETQCWDMVMRAFDTKAERLHYKDVFAKETKTSKQVIAEAMKHATKPSETKIDDHEFIIKDNCYYKEVMRGDSMVQERISNFIMTPQFDIQTGDEVIRVVDFTNIYGATVKGIRFDSESLSSTIKFNMKCISAGDFIFTGTQEDLFQICFTIFNTPKQVVHSPKRIGRLENGGWLFGNCAIDVDGQVMDMEDGRVTIGGTVYQPRSVTIEDGTESSSSDMPEFDTTKLMEVSNPDFLDDTATYMERTFGNKAVLLALGWCVAGWFSNEIFDRFGFYPYLFVTGKRSSGKSVLCTLLQQAYGFHASQAGMSIETPTNVGISRYLAYRSSLPQWYDDYRNDVRRITQKDGLLLDIYNRHGAVKGTRAGGDVRKETVNGFLLLSGEDTPSNNALLTRCVTVTLSAYERDPKAFSKAQECMEQLKNHGLIWASKATRGDTSIFEHIEKAKHEIFKRNGDIRYASNYSIFLGAFLWAFGEAIGEKRRKELMDYVCNFCVQDSIDVSSDHPMARFFHDFPDMPLIVGRDYRIADNPKRVHIRTQACHKAWEDYHRGAPIGLKTLRGYLKHEPFFLAEERVYFEGVGRQRCDTVLLEKMDTEFIDFCGFMEEMTRRPSV